MVVTFGKKLLRRNVYETFFYILRSDEAEIGLFSSMKILSTILTT